jgi:hypothetical protein
VLQRTARERESLCKWDNVKDLRGKVGIEYREGARQIASMRLNDEKYRHEKTTASVSLPNQTEIQKSRAKHE